MGHHAVRLDTPAAPTLNQVTLPASDHAASLAFYRALGLTPIVDARGEYARFESVGGTTLSIHQGSAATVFLEVPDLDAAVAAARAAGIAIGDPVDQRWGWREAATVDPAGNAIRLYTAGEHRRFPAMAPRMPGLNSRKALPARRRGGRGGARPACRPRSRRRGCPAGEARVPRGLDNSKKLSAKERARLAALVEERGIVGVGVVEPEEIDTLNIYWATMKAMTLAVDQIAQTLGAAPGHVLVDGNRLPRWTYAATAIVGGDGLSLSIAAASIVAKHRRDTIMIAHAKSHPHYGLGLEQGLRLRRAPRRAARTRPLPLHRRSFAPVAAAELRFPDR
ncbi:VOC family protein [Sphingomonas sp. MMS24-JH45]